MSAMETMLAGPLVQAIGWALLHLLWQGVLVAAILAAALALLQRQSANSRYLASCGALLFIVALGVATAYRGYDASVAAGASPAAARPGTAAPTLAPTSFDSPMEPSTVAARDSFASAVSFANAHLAQIVAIWLAGVLILSTRLVMGWIGAHRLTTRRSHAVEPQWEAALARIASALRLRRSITLLQSAAVQVPTVIGWLRPVVLLPVASLSGLSIQQIEMILAHELAHIRRHDFIVNLMQSVVETLLFYHPAVWWISRRIRVEREHCCDDLAVAVFGNPLQYARALTRFEELRLEAPQSVLAANGGSLLDRIRRLVAVRAESASWTSRWAAGAALLTVVAAVLLAPTIPLFAEHEQQTPPPPAAAAPKPEKAKHDPDKCPNETTPAPQAEVAPDPDPVVNPQPAVAPRAVIHPITVTTPIDISEVVTSALEASSEAIAAIVDDQRIRPPAVKRRTKIGASGKLSVDDLIILRSSGVEPKYIAEMRETGVGQLSLDDLVAMRMQGVTPAYVAALREAGVEVKTADELIALRVQEVDAAYVKALAEAGYANLSVNELIRLKVSGVDAEFIRELSKYRTK